MRFPLFGHSFFFAAALTASLFYPNIQASHFDESDDEDGTSLFERCLPNGLLDSQEKSLSLFLFQQPFTQESFSSQSDSSGHSSLFEEDDQSPLLLQPFHAHTPKTLLKNQSDEDSTEESSQSASLGNTLIPLPSSGKWPFNLYTDLPEALTSLSNKQPMTKRTFFNEKNIPIYKGVYYGLSNSFKQYVFEGSVLLKAGAQACRFLNLTSLYNGITPLWHNPLNTPLMSWTFLPRENALFSSFATEPIDPMFVSFEKPTDRAFDLTLNHGENMVARLAPNICGALFSSSSPFFLYKNDTLEISTPTSTIFFVLQGSQFNQWLKKTARHCTPDNTSLCVVRDEKRHFFPIHTSKSLSASYLPNTSLSRHDDDTDYDEGTSTQENSTDSVRILDEKKPLNPQKTKDKKTPPPCLSSKNHALYPTINADFHAYFQNHKKIKTLSLFNVADLTIYQNIHYTLSISPNHSTVFSSRQLANVGARLCAQLFLKSIHEKETSVWKVDKKPGEALWIYTPKSNPLFDAFMPTSFLKNRNLCGGIYVKGAFFDILPDDILTLSHLGRQYTYIIKGTDLNKRLTRFFDRGKQRVIALSSIKRGENTLYNWKS